MPLKKDLRINENGDLEIGANGDIAYSYDDDVTVDGILFRLKTYKGDYELEPGCGATLEDYIGQPNSAELGELVKQNIFNALTSDQFLDESEVSVGVAPLTAESLMVAITVEGIHGSFTVLSSLDLLTGKLQTITQ